MLIQMFRDNLRIIGNARINVATIAIKEWINPKPINTFAIIKAATPKAILKP
jgi:hypothetical protein